MNSPLVGLGLNVAGRGEYSYRTRIKPTGAQWVRLPLYYDYDVTNYVLELDSHGVKTLGVAASEFMTQDAGTWPHRAAELVDRYGNILCTQDNPDGPLILQGANEADANLHTDLNGDGIVSLQERKDTSPSSWVMDPWELNQLWQLFRSTPGLHNAFLVGGGLCSGDFTWVNQLRYDLVDMLGVHIYVDTGVEGISYMLNGYGSFGRPVLVSEYYSRIYWLSPWFVTKGIPAAAFCLTDGMVPGFGMEEDAGAMSSFVNAAKAVAPEEAPAIVVPGDGDIGEGFRTWQAREPSLLGVFDRPREFGPVEGISQIKTTRGVLTWCNANPGGTCFTFFEWITGDEYTWHPNWSSSRKVDR